MRHKAHSMSAQHLTSISFAEDVWFVQSRASSHITSHEDGVRTKREGKVIEERYKEITRRGIK